MGPQGPHGTPGPHGTALGNPSSPCLWARPLDHLTFPNKAKTQYESFGFEAVLEAFLSYVGAFGGFAGGCLEALRSVYGLLGDVLWTSWGLQWSFGRLIRLLEVSWRSWGLWQACCGRLG